MCVQDHFYFFFNDTAIFHSVCKLWLATITHTPVSATILEGYADRLPLLLRQWYTELRYTERDRIDGCLLFVWVLWCRGISYKGMEKVKAKGKEAYQENLYIPAPNSINLRNLRSITLPHTTCQLQRGGKTQMQYHFLHHQTSWITWFLASVHTLYKNSMTQVIGSSWTILQWLGFTHPQTCKWRSAFSPLYLHGWCGGVMHPC